MKNNWIANYDQVANIPTSWILGMLYFLFFVKSLSHHCCGICWVYWILWIVWMHKKDQNDCIFLQMAQPRTNSSPVGGCFIFKGHCSASRSIEVGPAGHLASLLVGMCFNLPASSWHLLQKWVVPKQKKTAREQQYLHLYSTNSAPCCWHTWK